MGSKAQFSLIHFTSGATAGGGPNGIALFQILQFSPSLAAQSFAGQNGGPYGNTPYVTKLSADALISAQQFTKASSYFGPNEGHLANGIGNVNSQWLSPGTGFVGFKFNIGQTGGAQYGWARITMDSGPSANTFTLNDYAFASPGETGVRTGQTSEVPDSGSSLGLLALGAAGLVAWRHRRANAASN